MGKVSNLAKEFLEYASFGVISMIGVALFILADTYFIANGIGPTAIAALNVAVPVSSILHGVGWLIGVGGSTIYAIARGKGETNQANAIFTFTVKLAAIGATLLSVVLVVFHAPILNFFGASSQTFELAKDYYLVHAFYGPFFILSNVFISFIRNDYNPRLATIATLIGGFSNIVFDYVFIYLFGWAMVGAAFATILSPAISLVVLSIHLRYPKRQLHFAPVQFDWHRITQIVTIGFSSFFNEISSGIVVVIFNISMLYFVGDIGVASYGIVYNINVIAILIFQGMANGIQPLISRYHGMEAFDKVKRVVTYGIVSMFVVATVMLSTNLLLSDFLINLFNSTGHSQMQALANQGLRYFSIAFIFASFNILTVFTLAAVEKSRASIFLSLLRGLLIIPPAMVILGNLYGLTGVWSTIILAEATTALVSIFFMARYLKSI